MSTPLSNLRVRMPVTAAPMAGGATTPEMVIAAASAGSLGFLAAGYKTAEALQDQISVVRGASIPFGVNLFAPNPVPVDVDAYRRYRAALQADADRLGVTLPESPIDDDDHFAAKTDLLTRDPVPIVSFTFGLPGAMVIRALQRAGTAVAQTVTSPAEARLAAEAGVDMLVVQASTAGGHSGTFTPDRLPAPMPITDLVRRVRETARLPVLAAGGLVTRADVRDVVAAGAEAVAVGTALLLTDESGASATHRAALTDPARTETVVTRAFTGRPARGLRNAFIERFESVVPLGYPAVHHLTGALRRAAAAAGEADLVHLWAGTGYRSVRRGTTAEVLTALTP